MVAGARLKAAGPLKDAQMSQTNQTEFAGEEEGAGYASPSVDIAAAVILIALAGWYSWEALGVRAPGGWHTAPGRRADRRRRQPDGHGAGAGLDRLAATGAAGGADCQVRRRRGARRYRADIAADRCAVRLPSGHGVLPLRVCAAMSAASTWWSAPFEIYHHPVPGRDDDAVPERPAVGHRHDFDHLHGISQHRLPQHLPDRAAGVVHHDRRIHSGPVALASAGGAGRGQPRHHLGRPARVVDDHGDGAADQPVDRAGAIQRAGLHAGGLYRQRVRGRHLGGAHQHSRHPRRGADDDRRPRPGQKGRGRSGAGHGDRRLVRRQLGRHPAAGLVHPAGAELCPAVPLVGNGAARHFHLRLDGLRRDAPERLDRRLAGDPGGTGRFRSDPRRAALYPPAFPN